MYIILLVIGLGLSGCSVDLPSIKDKPNLENTDIPSSSIDTAPPLPTESITSSVIEYVDYLEEGGELELPVIGSTGYTAVSLRFRTEGNLNSTIIATLNAGNPFKS